MFSAAPSGTLAQQFLHRARLFQNAAQSLPNYVGNEQNWPRYSLITHAIELTLKALWQHDNDHGGKHGNYPKHDLIKLYTTCLQCGLPQNHIEAEWIQYLSYIHSNHYMRYPQQPELTVADLSNGPDYAIDSLISTVTRLINK